MQRFTSILILLVCLALFPKVSDAGLFFNKTLVSIDEYSYSMDDFKRWWKFWNDNDSPLPETPDIYIDWLLLLDEADRINLASDPVFKRQTRVFLLSRTLLMLKYDAVDSQITLTDAEVKSHYDERYQPLMLVQQIKFKDEEAVTKALQELKSGALTIEELLKQNPDQGGPIKIDAGWVRPIKVDQEMFSFLQNLAVGEVAKQNKPESGNFLYYLEKRQEGTEEDFDKLRQQVRKDLWKKMEDVLTQKLLNELYEKYQVRIDHERLAALNIDAPENTFTDAPVITTDRENVSEKQFIAVIRRLIASRVGFSNAAIDMEEANRMKDNAVTNIIHQRLTNWEALDRHYEEKEPFKWEYEFNYNYRLVEGLKQRLFVSEANVSESEIKSYYEKNIDRYTQPTLVNLYIIDETQAPIEKIWANVAGGTYFEQAVTDIAELTMIAQEVPINHIDPEVKEVVEKLAEGETSPIFKSQGINVMVHLNRKIPGEPIELGKLRETIKSLLTEEKISQQYQNYVDALRSQAQIKIYMNNWKKIQKELGGI